MVLVMQLRSHVRNPTCQSSIVPGKVRWLTQHTTLCLVTGSSCRCWLTDLAESLQRIAYRWTYGIWNQHTYPLLTDNILTEISENVTLAVNMAKAGTSESIMILIGNSWSNRGECLISRCRVHPPWWNHATGAEVCLIMLLGTAYGNAAVKHASTWLG